MPSAKDLYRGGKYLAAADITRPTEARIVRAATEELKGVEKLVLTLEGVEKALIVNKTNADTLSEKFGDDYTAWVGQTVTIAAVPTTYQGQSVKGVRVL